VKVTNQSIIEDDLHPSKALSC